MNQIERAFKENELSVKSKVDVMNSDKIISLADEFGIRNTQWIDLYSIINGGYPNKNYYQYGDGRDFNVNNFFSLSNRDSGFENALKVKSLLFEGVDFFPLARDGGGNLLLIRTNSNDTSVYVWYNDTRGDPRPIASSILELLTKLEEFPEEDFD